MSTHARQRPYIEENMSDLRFPPRYSEKTVIFDITQRVVVISLPMFHDKKYRSWNVGKKLPLLVALTIYKSAVLLKKVFGL